MNRPFIVSIIKICLLFGAGLEASAANYYVAQTAAGDGSGSTAANAAGASFFNTGTNWGGSPAVSGKICPGDVVHLVGTISTPLVLQGGGTAGNPITLYFEPNAKLSAPYWATAAILAEGDNYAGLKSNITIDGGTNGIIEATQAGTGLAYTSSGYGIRTVGVSNFTVRNMTLRNLFVRKVSDDRSTPGTAISWIPAVNAPLSGLRVTNCVIDHAFIGISTNYDDRGVTDIEIDSNTITHTNWGVQCGSMRTGSTVKNINIHHNRIYNWSNWDEPATNNHHHNGIFVWTANGDTTGTCTDLKIHGNHLGPGYGGFATSGIYVSSAGHQDPNGPLIYNNLFETDTSNPTNGDIFVVPGPGAVTRIYNNTHTGPSGIAIGYGGDHGGAQTVHIKNNIVTGSGKTAVYIAYGSEVTCYINNNLYYGLQTSPAGFSYSASSTGAFRTFAQWQSMGFDAAGIFGKDPLLDSALAPKVGSPALNAGADLSAYLTTDVLGLVRSSAWTIGAYNLATTSSSLLPPSNARIQ
ncbi:MAG: hypothetical protein ABIZ04_12150 [Opitutus sp.]